MSEKGKVKPLKVVNVVSAIFVLGFFMALIYTVPKAISTFGIIEIKIALMNVFFLVWFGFLFKATKGENEDVG